MAEIFTPNPVQTFINDTTAVNTVNNNFTAISTAFNDVLSRSGVSPNQMTSTLDMNNNQIINLPPPSTVNSPARLIDVVTPGSITINTATTGTSGHVVPFLDGNNTWSGTNNFNPATGLNISYLATQNLTGTTGAGFVASGININSDSVNSTSGSMIAYQSNYIFGGSTAQGARYSIVGQVQLNAPTNATNNNRVYSGGLFQGIGNTGDGGISGTPQAQIFGVIGQSLLGAASTFIQIQSAASFGTLNALGSSVTFKALGTFQGLTGDSIGGSTVNTMLWLNNQNAGSVKWTNGILIDNWGGLGSFPLSGTATIFKVGTGTVTNGIDFSAVTFSGSPYISPGFSIGATGAMQSGSAGVSTGSVSLNGVTSGFVSIVGTATSGQLNINSSTNSTTVQIGTAGTSAGSIILTGLTSGSTTLNVSTTGGTLTVSGQTNVLGTFNTGNAGGTAGSVGIIGSTSGSSTLAVDATGNLQITPGGAGIIKINAAGSFTANGAGAAVTFGATTPAAITTPGTVAKWLTFTDNTGATFLVPGWH